MLNRNLVILNDVDKPHLKKDNLEVKKLNDDLSIISVAMSDYLVDFKHERLNHKALQLQPNIVVQEFLAHGFIEEIISLAASGKYRKTIESYMRDLHFSYVSFLSESISLVGGAELEENPYLGKYKTKNELIDVYKSINPEIDLNKYQSIIALLLDFYNDNKDEDVGSILNDISTYMYPNLVPYYYFFLKKYHRYEYINLIAGKNNYFGDRVFKANLDELTATKEVINKLFKLFPARSIESYYFRLKDNNELKSFFYKMLHETKIERANCAFSLKPSIDYAVCLSGQFRGAIECLPFWLEKARKLGVPVFISTWDQAGIPSGAHGAKLQRMLPEKISKDFVDITDAKFKDKCPQIYNSINNFDVNDELNNILQNYSDVDVSLLIHDENEFNVLHSSKNLNQYKMFFNITCVFDLLKRYESKKGVLFSNVIWARLDFKVEMFLPELIRNNSVKTSFSGTGAHLGDFLFQFNRAYLRTFQDIELFIDSIVSTESFSGSGPSLLGKIANNNGLFIEVFQTSQLVFSGLRALKIPLSSFLKFPNEIAFLDKNTRQKIALLCNLDCCEIDLNNVEKLSVGNDALISLIRDFACSIEKYRPKDAYKLMRLALSLRPQGLFLKMKVEEYERNNIPHSVI